MHCICLLTVMLNANFCEMQGLAPCLNLPWDEPVPDHSTIGRYLQRISTGWLEKTLAMTAQACTAQSGNVDGPAASDSTGVETGRYEKCSRPDRDRRGFVKTRRKKYLKWHVTALLEPKVILSCMVTSGKTADSPILGRMLGKIKRAGICTDGRMFCADRGYD